MVLKAGNGGVVYSHLEKTFGDHAPMAEVRLHASHQCVCSRNLYLVLPALRSTHHFCYCRQVQPVHFLICGLEFYSCDSTPKSTFNAFVTRISGHL